MKTHFYPNLKKAIKIWPLLTFAMLGIASTIWFLIRVIPKPARAGYPCMKAAAPFMSGFVVYLISVTGALFAFKNFRTRMTTAKYLSAFSFLIVAAAMFVVADMAQSKRAYAFNRVSSSSFQANSPVGVAQGLHPGRVVWVWDQNATDNNFEVKNNASNWWINYTNGDVVENMLQKAVKQYAGKNNLTEAWDDLFKHFNNNKNKGNIGYTPGEKIYIKVNLTNSSQATSGTKKTGNYNRMDSTPEIMLALIKQLIEEVGVAQEDIYMGDPFRTFRDEYWEVCHSVYPNVNYTDGKGQNGRYKTVPTSENKMIFSDKKLTYRLPQEYYEADYFINMPCLKSHDSAGITIGTKNHQGSILQDGAQPAEQSAFAMHYTFPYQDDSEGGTHRYRQLVDYNGHEKLGGNTLLTIVDGIWAGRSWEGFVEKWQMSPFNGDYPNSILISQDLVAIDAVCYDFLLEEYKSKSTDQQYPYMAGTNDYLLQSADPSTWPDGIQYDPEGDGTILTSMGVYEHWNNPTDKEYSRNLGTGSGIELVKVFATDEFPKIITAQNSQLPNNNVNAIYVDSSNVAWIGTDAGLARFDRETWTIFTTENHLLNNKVNDIAYEKTTYGDEVWVATDGGLTVAAFNVDGVTSATTYTPDNSDIVGTVVSNVMVDKHHNRWIGTETAINIFRGSSWAHILASTNSNGDAFNLADFPVTDIAEYHHNDMTFITTSGKGILRMNYNEIDGFTGASTYGQPWSSIPTDKITAAAMNGVDQWYGSDNGVIHHPSSEAKSDWNIYTNEEHHLFDNDITSIHVDQSSNVWVGTNLGLNIIKSDGSILKYDESLGLVNNVINIITADTKGNVWIGTSGGIQWFEEVPGISVSTSVKKSGLSQKVKVYPNPASSFLQIEIGIDKPQQVKVSVYNSNGQLIDIPLEQSVQSLKHSLTLDVSNKSVYRQGLYLVRIETREFTSIHKVNIQ